MQENELASLVRDTGLATDAFPIARIHTLYAQVADSDQLTLPGFVTLLLLVAVHRANPTYGSSPGGGPPSAPLPGCLATMLERNILKGKKREKQAEIKSAVKGLDTKALFKPSRAALKKEFDAACRAKEKGRTLFGGLVMSVGTLVGEFKERGLLGMRTVTPTAAVTGAACSDVEVELSAADVERAFVSCQDGAGGEEGNATIDFDEFLTALALCGQIKFEAVKEMSLAQRVSAVVATYLREQSEAAVISAVVSPPVARFDASGVVALMGHSGAEHDRWME